MIELTRVTTKKQNFISKALDRRVGVKRRDARIELSVRKVATRQDKFVVDKFVKRTSQSCVWKKGTRRYGNYGQYRLRELESPSS